MKKDEIIETLKSHYPRDVRKNLIRAIQAQEKIEDKLALKEQYKIINQIFSYVLHESNWEMNQSSGNWDNTPLEIVAEVFPKLSSTKWYKEQVILTSKDIEVQNNEEK